MRLLLVAVIVLSSQAYAQNVYENIKQRNGVSTSVKKPVKAPAAVKR